MLLRQSAGTDVDTDRDCSATGTAKKVKRLLPVVKRLMEHLLLLQHIGVGYDIKVLDQSAIADVDGDNVLKKFNTDNALRKLVTYEIVTVGASFGDTTAAK